MLVAVLKHIINEHREVEMNYKQLMQDHSKLVSENKETFSIDMGHLIKDGIDPYDWEEGYKHGLGVSTYLLEHLVEKESANQVPYEAIVEVFKGQLEDKTALEKNLETVSSAYDKLNGKYKDLEVEYLELGDYVTYLENQLCEEKLKNAESELRKEIGRLVSRIHTLEGKLYEAENNEAGIIYELKNLLDTAQARFR